MIFLSSDPSFPQLLTEILTPENIVFLQRIIIYSIHTYNINYKLQLLYNITFTSIKYYYNVCVCVHRFGRSYTCMYHMYLSYYDPLHAFLLHTIKYRQYVQDAPRRFDK